MERYRCQQLLIVQSIKKAIPEKNPSLHDIYATVDGLTLYLEQSSDVVIQNMFYNAWKSDKFIINVLLFVPAGHITGEIYNAPGCMHESQVSELGGLYARLENFYTGQVGEFSLTQPSTNQYRFIIKSAQDDTTWEGPVEINLYGQAK